jgi:hypothetical protein
MKLIITTIALCLLFPALMAQDPTPAVEPQDTIPAVAPAVEPQDTVAAAAPVAAPAEEPAEQPKEQPAEKPSWKTKIYYGGYINFSFGSYTSIGIEPMVGYKIIPRLSVGLKIRYDYVQHKYNGTTYSYSDYGGSLFSRLSLFKRLYVHAEYATYNYESTNYVDPENSERIWVPFFFVGAGFNQPIGGRASLNAQILFDVLQSDKSPYNSWEPFYSVGVSVGF